MQVLKEADGKWSFARIFGAVIIAVLLVTGARVVWMTGGQFPDIPTNWMILVGGLYGFNKFNS